MTDDKDLSRFVTGGLWFGGLDLLKELLEDPHERLIVFRPKNLRDKRPALVEKLAGEFESHQGEVSYREEPTMRWFAIISPPMQCNAYTPSSRTLRKGIILPVGTDVWSAIIENHVHLPRLQFFPKSLKTQHRVDDALISQLCLLAELNINTHLSAFFSSDVFLQGDDIRDGFDRDQIHT